MKKRYSSIIIQNITEKDVNRKQIRILKHNKFIFPEEKRGISKEYSLSFYYKRKLYDCTYIIGSMDGKSRSGILRLNTILYKNQLQITPISKIKIIQTSSHKYLIKRNMTYLQLLLVEVFSFIKRVKQRIFYSSNM